jgi:Fe-S cluster assembly protein SufD
MTEGSASRTPFVQSMLDAATQSPLPASGIAWLDAARRENLEAFAATGLPDTRKEAWKYTALRALGQRSFALVDADAAREVAVDPASFELPGVGGARIVFVNGVFRADLSRLDAPVEGLTVQPLSQALIDQPEPLRFALSRHYRDSADAFAQINASLASDGLVLRVAAGVTVDKPVHVVYVGAPAQGDLAWHARSVVEIGEEASVDLVEHHVAAGAHAQLGTLVTDYVLRDRAGLRLTVVQDAAPGATLVRRNHARLGAKANATVHVLELGGALVRHELTAELAGDGSRFDTRGVFTLRGRQHVDTQLAVRHIARDTASDALWRGVADERSRGVFRGAIIVAEGADGSDAKLSNKNLLLSAQAEIDTKPELEIYADEVKAAHGATIGQLDERSQFYLRSRGIPLGEARSLLTLAFCRAALQSLDNEPLREHLGDLLVKHLPHGDPAA